MRSSYKRNSNIEFLRILSMLFIVTSHASAHSGIEITSLPFSITKLYLQMSMLGNLGVDVFVILTGYLLCNGKYQWKKVLILVAQIWFYSVLTWLISVFVFHKERGISAVLQACFPILFEKYWFATAYVCLIFLTPLLNAAIQGLTEREYKKALLIVLAMWCFIPTFTTRGMYGTHVPQMIMLYLLGAYMRKHPNTVISTTKQRMAVLLLGMFMYFSSIVILDLLSIRIGFVGKYATYFNSRNALPTIMIATSLVSFAVNAKPKYSVCINTVASSMFGVYLFHDSPNMREIIWQDIFANYQYVDTSMFIPRMIISVFIVFTICVVIELGRQRLIGSLIEAGAEKTMQRFGDFIHSICKDKNVNNDERN